MVSPYFLTGYSLPTHYSGTNSIALDSFSRPHISYCSRNTQYLGCKCDDLKYAWYDGFRWNIETLDTEGNVGDFNSLVLRGDKPHISYYDSSKGDLKFFYKDALGGGHIQTIDSVGDVGKDSSMVWGYDRFHINYLDATNNFLKYARSSGGSWIIETIDNNGDTGYYGSIDYCMSSPPGAPRIIY